MESERNAKVAKRRELLQKLPREGFLKLTKAPGEIPQEQKTALIRKGNELFNAGKYELAKRIFLTTGYSDGLIRVGEYYEREGQKLEAFRMYWIAGFHRKTEAMVERMVLILRGWLRDE